MATKIRRLEDGTLQTVGAFYARDDVTRVALASMFRYKTVELVMRDGSTIVGDVVTAALMRAGSTSGVLVLTIDGELVPTAIGTATISSIAELTAAEYAQRVHA